MNDAEVMTLCERCGLRCVDQSGALCEFFGIANARLVATGFMLYDSTQDKDVPDLDSCDRPDCPGLAKGAA